MNIAALMPVKGFRNAKQRLSPLLSQAEREALSEAMFRDALSQVRIARGLSAVFVVTPDDKVAAIASSFGAVVIREPAERGETSAVDFARVEVKQSGCDCVLVLPGDLPLLRATDIENILGQIPTGASAPFALLVPSHDRLGTNALLLAPPDVIELRFGYDSFTFHMNQLAAQGLPARFFENERIALDIDEPKDLERFLSYQAEDGAAARMVRRALTQAESWAKRHSGGA